MLILTNPANGERIAELPTDDAASVAAKTAAARAAQPAWAATPMRQKRATIGRFRDAFLAESEQLAQTLSREMGKPIRQARSEVTSLRVRVEFFMAQAEQTLAAEMLFEDGGMREAIQHAPLGVIANISAWNYPWFVGCNVLVPALLAGNAVLYKPSEHATLSGTHLVRLMHAAGVPPGVLQLVVGAGDVGRALCDQRIDGMFFTGSHATGQRIASVLAPRMVKLQLELGGKDPTWVRADADVKVAAESLADGAMYNTGQSCCSVERIYVHESIHDAFVEHFLATVDGFVLGDPLDEATYIGPLARAPQVDVLAAQVADAVAKGAAVRRGGTRVTGPFGGAGNWFAPTVLTGVDHRMDVMREESFGPIIGIQKVASDDEAVALMNDTRYGLTAGVFTRSARAAGAILSKVNAGTTYWNCCDRVSPRLPWRGHGDSGIGLTLSTHGIL
ncbi:MAG: aldehyde dehydrogenase family protein, partial [Aquabacterium sp.]